MPRFLTITSVPAGDAPLWVREHWVGPSLPLARRTAVPRSVLTSGVLSAPKNLIAWIGMLLSGKFVRKRGFMVEANAAVAVLARAHPDAASWWRENAPDFFEGKRYFVFQESSGQVVDHDGEP
jgi:hypothetical protein